MKVDWKDNLICDLLEQRRRLQARIEWLHQHLAAARGIEVEDIELEDAEWRWWKEEEV